MPQPSRNRIKVLISPSFPSHGKEKRECFSAWGLGQCLLGGSADRLANVVTQKLDTHRYIHATPQPLLSISGGYASAPNPMTTTVHRVTSASCVIINYVRVSDSIRPKF